MGHLRPRRGLHFAQTLTCFTGERDTLNQIIFLSSFSRPIYQGFAVPNINSVHSSIISIQDPHTCHESSSYPTFFFPAFTFVHHCNGVGKIGPCLDGDKGLPELLQNVLSCELGSCTWLGIWPCFAMLFHRNGSSLLSALP